MRTKQTILFYTIILGVLLAMASGCKKEEDDDTKKSANTTFTDPRDGNVYKTVSIGNQVWMTENLRYSGNLPEVKDKITWWLIFDNFSESPAWCYYDNDPANEGRYGKLYNWHAMNTEPLCPPGWHIPSNAEWAVLEDFLGGTSVAGGKMKSTSGWDSPNVGANNSSGFSGFPGGQRDPNGDFTDFGSSGFWWSTTIDTAYGPHAVTHRYLTNGQASLGESTYLYAKERGMSCRCIKD